MNIIDACVLALVEGITEFLPVSSTGHLILVSRLLGVPDTSFVRSFTIIIQLGAIFAITLLYIRQLMQSKKILITTLLGFLPTAIIGFTLYRLIKNVLLNNQLVVIISLLLGGIAIIVIEKYIEKTKKTTISLEKLPNSHALIIGSAQTLALIPGVSRSAATILSSLLLGLDKKSAVLYSFLLSIPTLYAAAGYDLLKTGVTFSFSEWQLLFVGCIISCITASIVVRWFLNFVSTKSLLPFAYYRIALALVYFFVLYLLK